MQINIKLNVCTAKNLKSADCEKKEEKREEKLCFDCTKPKHLANDCSSSKACLICKNKHHTSICDKRLNTSTEPLLTTTENDVIYPVAIVKVNGV